MADQSIEQFIRQTPRRQRPNHISMPSMGAVSPSAHIDQPAQSDRTKVQAASSTPPRPPIPPRRHTLAEICRYADEQCAYIEWMTRQLEAEEAARRRSCPTTPIGAITNPFSGPADMWWRPTSANEMYGKSALRRQQEAEQDTIQESSSYFAMKGLPGLVEKDSRTNEREQNTTSCCEPRTDTTLPILLTCEPAEIDELSRPEIGRDQEPDNVKELSTEDSPSICKHEAWLDKARAPTVAEEDSSQTLSSGASLLEQGSIVLIIPKAMVCFLLLPLVLMVFLVDGGGDMDEELDREDG